MFNSEVLLGDRKLTLLPVTLSIFMSFFSAILVLGNTAEMSSHGAQYYLQVVGKGLGVVAVAHIVVPILYPLKLTNSYEVNYFITGTFSLITFLRVKD